MENEGILYVFPVFHTADWEQKIRCPAADDLFRVSLGMAAVVGVGGLGNAFLQNGQNRSGAIFQRDG